MDFLLNRYRNLTVLLLVIVAQLLLLAYQVKSNQEVRLIRVWAVTAVTPLAKAIETVRSSTYRFLTDYFILLDVRDENRHMKAELGRLKLENQFLKSELSTADRARALAVFQTRSPSKTIAASIIGSGTGANAKVILVDRGTASGVENGMAVITPDGIVGKVIGAYPTASQVLLITDPTFAAGVISQKNRVHGTLKGLGHSTCLVDYVQNEEQVEVGEWFYTSGDDRIFPKGLPVGQAVVVRPGKSLKEIYLAPSGFQDGFEEVLIVIEGVHQNIPDRPLPDQPIHLLPPPPPDGNAPAVTTPANAQSALSTDADRLLDRYRRIGEAEKHEYGQYGSAVPDFNIHPAEPQSQSPASPPAQGQPGDPAPSPPGAPRPPAP